ncbi:MAG: hypothetical protein GXP63_00985 [DPANN group archaeon]|nr:hypothetical protein [DPANN group archaeon]
MDDKRGDTLYSKVSGEDFRDDVDQWIKGFKRDIDCFSNELDDLSDEFSKQREEHLLFYENLDRVEQKVDHLQASFEKMAVLLGRQAELSGTVQPLKERYPAIPK